VLFNLADKASGGADFGAAVATEGTPNCTISRNIINSPLNHTFLELFTLDCSFIGSLFLMVNYDADNKTFPLSVDASRAQKNAVFLEIPKSSAADIPTDLEVISGFKDFRQPGYP
jgi:hypothetical protein